MRGEVTAAGKAGRGSRAECWCADVPRLQVRLARTQAARDELRVGELINADSRKKEGFFTLQLMKAEGTRADDDAPQ